MRIFILLSVIFIHQIYGQDLQRDYDLLAKYVILKNALLDDPSMPVSIQKSLHQIETLMTSSAYEYEIEVLDSISVFKIISIIDHTNIRLHSYYKTIIAIDTSSKEIDRYTIITDANLMDFIKDKLYKNISIEDRLKLTNFYNIIYAYERNNYFDKYEFYSKENSELFKRFKLSELLHEVVNQDLLKKRDSYNHYYIITDNQGNLKDFYKTVYLFKCDNLEVEHKLLIRK